MEKQMGQQNQSRKLIVIYGINNLGKSTQAKLLRSRIELESGSARYLKYPLYDLEPTGPVIDDYLRKGNPHNLSPREFQIIQILNRTQFQRSLFAILADSHVVAEDYVGTGIAWGMGAGVDKDFLMLMNSHLLRPSIAILFDGTRFDDGKEKGHTHEEDDTLTEKVREAHLELADDLGWSVVNANQAIDVVHEQVWDTVSKSLNT